MTTESDTEHFENDSWMEGEPYESDDDEKPTDRAFVTYTLTRHDVEVPTSAAQISVTLRKGRRAELRVPGSDAVQMLDVVVYGSAAAATAASPALTLQWLGTALPGWALIMTTLIQMALVGGLATLILRRRRR